MAACRGLGMQAREKRKKEDESSSGKEAQQHGDTLEKKVLCSKRNCQQAGAGIARKLWRDKGACGEMGIKSVCLNKRILSVFTKFFCPTFLPLHAMAMINLSTK